jgi:hypothetical protein
LDVRILDKAYWVDPISPQTLECPLVRDPMIDLNIVRGWVDECDGSHETPNKSFSSLPKGFRVIDVKRRRVIEAPDVCDFARVLQKYRE